MTGRAHEGEDARGNRVQLGPVPGKGPLVVRMLDVAFAHPKTHPQNGCWTAYWLSTAAPDIGMHAVLAGLGKGKKMQLALQDLINQTSRRLGRTVDVGICKT